MSQWRDATPDLVLVLNGVFDVLVKKRLTRKYFMIAETVPEVVSHYLKQVKSGQEPFEIFFDEAKWIFNPLTGVDICDYNNPDRKKRRMNNSLNTTNIRLQTPCSPSLTRQYWT